MALNTTLTRWTEIRGRPSGSLGVMGVFYLSKRRAVYFGHKSIVHACDASEWVGMHSVCIKRHWPPLARPKPHFHSRNSLPLPYQSFPLFRRVDLVISTKVYSATAGTVQRTLDFKTVPTVVEIIIKFREFHLSLKAVLFLTRDKPLIHTEMNFYN